MSSRAAMLGRIRKALGRREGEPAPAAPPVLLTDAHFDDRIHIFRTRLELLNAQTYAVRDRTELLAVVQGIAGDRSAYLSGKVRWLAEFLRTTDAVASAEVGITGADYGLAETATLVTLAVTDERLASLLPPVHIALVEERRVLANLDEFLTLASLPAEASSSTVFITGPSRTGDIEQILVRGVHGPGELHVVILSGLT